MFGKEKRINPLTDHQDVLIQVVKDIELTKKCVVSANSSYLVMILVDNKPICTIKNCRDKVIYKEIGKEYLGSLITILFVLNTTIIESSWGFGDVYVNNSRLKEAYRLGTNGEYVLKINDPFLLYLAMPLESQITTSIIHQKVFSSIKTVGVTLLSSYFSFSDVSIFEIGSKIMEFRDKFLEMINEQKVLELLGIEIVSLTVNTIKAPEDDMNKIKERINSEE